MVSLRHTDMDASSIGRRQWSAISDSDFYQRFPLQGRVSVARGTPFQFSEALGALNATLDFQPVGLEHMPAREVVPIPVLASKRLLGVMLALVAIAPVAHAQIASVAGQSHRVALVIGNAKYEGGAWNTLRNPSRDAVAVASALKALGFELVGCNNQPVCLDADRVTMDQAIKTFGRRLAEKPNGIAFFYYSGHGTQARSEDDGSADNFLVPIRSGLEDDFQIDTKAVPLKDVLVMLRRVPIQGGVVVLDACRDNNLQRTSTKSATIAANKGLARVGSGDVIVAYAAAEGRTASDGSGNLSPYTRRLVEQLQLPGKSIQDVLIDVGDLVDQDTRGAQKPEALIRGKRLFLSGPRQSSEEVNSRPDDSSRTDLFFAVEGTPIGVAQARLNEIVKRVSPLSEAVPGNGGVTFPTQSGYRAYLTVTEVQEAPYLMCVFAGWEGFPSVDAVASLNHLIVGVVTIREDQTLTYSNSLSARGGVTNEDVESLIRTCAADISIVTASVRPQK